MVEALLSWQLFDLWNKHNQIHVKINANVVWENTPTWHIMSAIIASDISQQCLLCSSRSEFVLSSFHAQWFIADLAGTLCPPNFSL
jgi:hypothetical protein